MIYRLKDILHSEFNIIGKLEQIAEFLNYPTNIEYSDLKSRLYNDKLYHNKYVDYSIEESVAHVAVKETGEFIINVRDINQGIKVIEMLETEDDINGEYEPNWYDIVDDNHVSVMP